LTIIGRAEIALTTDPERILTSVPDVVGSRRPALAAAIPTIDAVALGVSVAVADALGWPALVYVTLAFVALWALGGHGERINPRLGDDVGRLLAAVAVPVLVVALLSPTARASGALLLLGPLSAGLVIGGRAVTYGLIRTMRSRGLVRERTLVVGAGEVGRTLAQTLTDHPEYGLVPMGFLDAVEDDDLPLPLLGSIGDLERVVRELEIDRVIVAFGLVPESEMIEAFRACENLPVEVSLVPRLFELGVSWPGPGKDEVWGIPLVRVRRAVLGTAARRIKRLSDLVVASAILVLSAPIFLGAAVAVRLSSRGPVFFRQRRIGQGGRVFQVLKFRTMRVNQDADTTWSKDGDGGVTRVGKVLRRTGLDELPQLINVLRGQMSLIGPRPERPYFVDRFSRNVSRYGARHRVPVGITGWAQVHGLRGDTSIPERVRFDNYYIENWSVWTDVLIVARTVKLLLTGKH
jgi:exopolysaccharide biosynthesis polyprenyl glycosylphosphotransferase